MRLPNDIRPLSLDGEFAYVHLGRFIEVIHSKSYSDSISLGLDIKGVSYVTYDDETRGSRQTGDVRATYTFRCVKRTQDVYLDNAEIQIGTLTYEANRINDRYLLTCASLDAKMGFDLKDGFLFSDSFAVRGIDFSEFLKFSPLFDAQRAIQSELQKTQYLGPFRQSPLRRYPTRGSNPNEVGAQGEATATMLANEIIQSRKRPHIKQIASWLSLLGLAKRLDVSRVARSDLFDVNLTLKDGDTFPIADLGYGLSQVLPVLTQCSFAQSGSTLLFEQPELHLHSLAARPLASVFIETAKKKKVHIVAETHSPELFKQFLCEMRNGRIGLEDFVAHRVVREKQRSVLQMIEIDADNEMDVYENWESGISVR